MLRSGLNRLGNPFARILNHKQDRRLRRGRPIVECLEDRLAPAVLHWQGAAGAGGTSWNTLANWVESATPQNGDTVVFDTANTINNFTSTNDIAGLTLAGIQVNDASATGDFTINGNPITLGVAGITHSLSVGSATTLGFSSITLGAFVTILNNAGTLNVASDIDLHGLGLTAAGAGVTSISGVISGTGSSPIAGLKGDYFNVVPTTAMLDPTDPSWLGNQTPTVTRITADVNFPNNYVANFSFTPYANIGTNNVAARWTGTITIPTTGTYTFFTQSDDGSRLFIDGIMVVDNNFFQGSTQRQGSIPLTAGAHAIDIEFYQGGGGADMTASWDPTGGNTPTIIPSTVLSTVTPGLNTLTKTGSGTLILGGANTYAGATAIDQGTLVVTVDGALGSTAAGTTVSGGATLAFSGGVNYLTPEAVSINSFGAAGNGGIENLSADNTFAGPITLAGPASVGSDAGLLTLAGTIDLHGQTLRVTGAGNTTLSGVISGTGSFTTAGLNGDYFNVGASTALLDPTSPSWLGNQTPTVTQLTPQVNFPNSYVSNFSFTPYANIGTTNVAARWTGTITIPTTGNYTFFTQSDDGSRLFIDGIMVVDNNFFQGSTQRQGSIPLTAGAHAIDIEFFQGGGGADMTASWDPTGGNTPTIIPSSVLSVTANSNSLVKTGSGTLTLSNANTYAGTTTINQGILVVAADSALGSTAGVTLVNAGGALDFNGGLDYATAEPVTINGTGAGGNGAIENLAGNNTFAGLITLATSATIGSDAGLMTLSGSVDLHGFGLTVTGAGNTAISGSVTGAAQTLPGLKGDYFNVTGSTALLDPTSPSWLGNLTPTVTQITPQVDFPNNYVANNSFTPFANIGTSDVAARWTGTITVPTTGSYTFFTKSDDGSRLFIDGTLVVENNFFQGSSQRQGSIALTAGAHAIDIEFFQGGGGADMTASWDPTGGNNPTIIPSSVFSFQNLNTLTKTGTGTLTLSASNSYSGATNINQGTLVATADGALGTTGSGTTVASGGTLAFAGDVNYSTAEAVTVSGTGAGGTGAINNLSGNNRFAGAITLAGDAAINSSTAGNVLTLDGNVAAGNHQLTVTGPGDVTVNGVISSPASIPGLTGDYFSINASTALLDPTSPSWLGNQTPTVTQITPQVNFPNNYVANNSFTPFANIGTSNVAARWTGAITVPTTGTYTFFTQSDDGSRLFIDGTLVVDNNNFQGSTQRQGSIPLTAGAHAIDIEFFQGGGGADMTASWDPTGGNTATIIPASVLSNLLNNNALNKTGTGTLTLNANNAYSGPTTVSAGTLLINGSQPSSPVTVTGGVLGSSVAADTIGALTASGGSVSPNMSAAGIINTSGNLALTAGSTDVDLGGTTAGSGYDQLNVTGTVTLGGTLNVSLIGGFTPNYGNQFVLINNDLGDLVSGTFAGLGEGATFALGTSTFKITYQGGNGNDVVLTDIDVTPPTSSMAFPVTGGLYGLTTWAAISGTASDEPHGSGVLQEQVSVQQVSSGLYWNGSAFASGTEQFFAATGTTSWSYPFAASNFTADGTYQVHSQAVDVAGNIESPGSQATFFFDGHVPTSVVSFPAAGASYNNAGWTNSITGTASDPAGGSGLAQVQISIRNNSTGLFWNGSAFASAAEQFVTVTGTASWTYAFPVGNFPSFGSYQVHSRAVDGAGNIESPGPTASFVYDNGPVIVVASQRLDADPTNAAHVRFLVTFNKNVAGVDLGDFQLVTTGTLLATAITSVSGSGSTYTVTVSTGIQEGTLQLIVVDNDSIHDAAGNILGGPGAGNGSFTTGEFYNVIKRDFLVTGTDAGGAPEVKVFDAHTLDMRFDFLAYDPLFRGGVHVAVGDLSGDGIPDIITAPGAGGGPLVQVFSGTDLSLLVAFNAYDPNYLNGLFVAVGDVNGDGTPDIVTAPDQGGGPLLYVYSGKALMAGVKPDQALIAPGFNVYDPNFQGGVRVAVGDTNGDGFADVITAPGYGGGTLVYAFSGQALAAGLTSTPALLLPGFNAYDGQFQGGVFVAAADMDGDGKADIITTPGIGGGPEVEIFRGSTGTLIAAFNAFPPVPIVREIKDNTFAAGQSVHVAAVDINADGRSELLVGPGRFQQPDVRVYDSISLTLIDDFFAYDPLFFGGVFVGGGH